MKKIKLLKSILIPTLGITSIGTIPVVSTSCGEVHVTSVATVENGKIAAVGLGTATITVKTNDGGLTATLCCCS